MSICKYSGQKAGLFSDCHKECEAKHAQGLVRLRKLMDDYFRNTNGVTTILQEEYVEDEVEVGFWVR